MNSDQLTTYIGLAKAIATAAVTFYSTASAEGNVDIKNPIFWIGMAIATLMGVQGYWTNKHLTPAPAPKIPSPPGA